MKPLRYSNELNGLKKTEKKKQKSPNRTHMKQTENHHHNSNKYNLEEMFCSQKGFHTVFVKLWRIKQALFS